MSHIKKHIEEHEDGVCSHDPATCLACARDEFHEREGEPVVLTPPQDEDGTQPLIRPDELQRQLQERLDTVTLSRDYDTGMFHDFALRLKRDPSLLAECAHRFPGSYDIVRAALLDLESQMIDEARSDYERDELAP